MWLEATPQGGIFHWLGDIPKRMRANKQTCTKCRRHIPKLVLYLFHYIKRNCFAKYYRCKTQKPQIHAVERLPEEFYIDMVTSSKIIDMNKILPVERQGAIASFKSDTGAQISILSESEYRKLKMRPNMSN